ncbi:MAG: DedA family protein [Gemmatimonadota bacterium]
MQEQLELLLRLIGEVPVGTIYLLIAAGTLLENFFPPVPSDTFVVAAGILVDHGLVTGPTVFGVALTSNVLGALFVYVGARRYGEAVFQTRWGKRLLRPSQLQRLSVFYARYGVATIFLSRFIPVFRVIVPAFAGISRVGALSTAIPLITASALWYGTLVLAGIFVSQNLPRLTGLLQVFNSTAGIVALLLALVLGVWWWRTREGEPEDSDEEDEEADDRPRA